MIFIRLWHIDLIPYLPKSQLIAQWRELNSIFKKQDKHILINYVYDYDWLAFPKHYLTELRFKEHNKQYLTMNYWNLAEKYIRGQKDFTTAIWKKLDEFYKKEMMQSE